MRARPERSHEVVTSNERPFARNVAQTFRRRFHSGTGHSIPSGEVLLLGHC